MKQKVFFRRGLWFWLVFATLLLVLGFCCFILVKAFSVKNFWCWFDLIISIITLIIMCGFLRFRITFNEKFVTITKTIGPRTMQHKCQVNYIDIKNIKLSLSRLNSKDEIPLGYNSNVFWGQILHHTFIEIKTEKNSFNFWVSFYSKHQLYNIINEIKQRCDTAGNHSLNGIDVKTICDEFFKNRRKKTLHGY